MLHVATQLSTGDMVKCFKKLSCHVMSCLQLKVDFDKRGGEQDTKLCWFTYCIGRKRMCMCAGGGGGGEESTST